MNPFARPRSWSLKTKLALGGGLLIFAFSVASTSWLLRSLQDDVRRSVTDAQTALVLATAQDIDEKINERRSALVKTARVLALAAPAPGDETDEFFRSHPVLADMFDALLVVDAAGRVVHDWPHVPGRRQLDVADRDYFKRVMAGASSVISPPLMSRDNGDPIVVFAAALRTREGRPTGMLVATLGLTRPNFLGALGQARIGRDGYFVLVEKGAHPLLVMSGRRSDAAHGAVAAAAADAGTDAQLAPALAGFEGSLQGTDAAGTETLRSYTALGAVPWGLIAVYPTAEAFAGLRTRQRELLGVAGALFALTAGIAWLLVQRLLRPLTRLQAVMAAQASEPERLLAPASMGSAELVAVVEAYNAQAERRREFELRLRASERRLQAITDNMPAFIVHIDTAQRYTFVNALFARSFASDPTGLVGRTICEVRGDAVYRDLAPRAAQVLAGEAVSFETRELEHGEPVYRQVNYIPDTDEAGQVRGFYAMTQDITQRKLAGLRQAASEQQLLDLTNSIPALVGFFDMQERCQYANDSGLRSLGLDRADIPGIGMRAALGEATYAQHLPSVKEALQGRRARLEFRVPFAGREAHFQAHLIPHRVDGGAQRGFYLMTFDITALKEAEGRQARVERQLRAITDNLPVLISYIDQQQCFCFLNATFKHWLGIDPAQVLGRPVAEIAEFGLFDDGVSGQANLTRCLGGERVAFEADINAQGVKRNLHITYIPDILPDGEVAGLYALCTDVTPMKQAERQLRLQVRRDTLTGIANRYQFNEVLPLALERCRGAGLGLGLMFLDIDHFKAINDGFGHAVGDSVLKEFARRVQDTIRTTDTVARLAGDEFVVILEGLHDAFEAQIVACKIITEIGRAFVLGEHSLTVTTSLGIACTDAAAVTGPELLARADAALYAAKAAGRNSFRLSTV